MMGKDSVPEKDDANAEVDFDYVAPSEPYYHVVRSLLS